MDDHFGVFEVVCGDNRGARPGAVVAEVVAVLVALVSNRVETVIYQPAAVMRVRVMNRVVSVRDDLLPPCFSLQHLIVIILILVMMCIWRSQNGKKQSSNNSRAAVEEETQRAAAAAASEGW